MDHSDDPPTRRRRGLLVVLSSPSGAGKTTISRMLLESDPDVTMSVSVTTRPKRPGEVEGVDYHFVDDAEFDRLIDVGEFVEWAPVFGFRYGTPKAPVKDALRNGRDILFDIDWQGTQQLHSAMGEDLVRIFILPPSMAELERRLRERATESAGEIGERLDLAQHQLMQETEFDYVVENDAVDRATEELVGIVRRVLDGAATMLP